jgi:nickel-type superoxide dismutase maturation protease
MGPVAATLPSHGRRMPRRSAVAAGLVVLGSAAAGWTLARGVRRVVVEGTSMAPTFLPGDRLVVLVRPVGPAGLPGPGTVVALSDPREPDRILVKRVTSVDRAAGTLEVAGDDPGASTDSRTFGPVGRSSLLGRVVYRYAPVGRTGPGPWPRGYDPS